MRTNFHDHRSEHLRNFTIFCVLAAGTTWASAQGLSRASPESVGMSAERLAVLGTAMKEEVTNGRLPGVVVMVARQGKLVYSEAFGKLNNASGGDMKVDSLFRLYSMTKPLTSTALMMLVEEGKVQLSDPVSKYLPTFKNPVVSTPSIHPVTGAVTYRMVAANQEPTLYDLLRHTSGLAYPQLTSNAPVRDAYVKAKLLPESISALNPDDMSEALGKIALAQQPGTTWEYSLSTDALGRVVEVVSGKRLADFLSERIFKPLRMADTGFHVPAAQTRRLAEPFSKDPVTGVSQEMFDVITPPLTDSGGGGGVGTASDYLRYCQAMLNGGQLDGARIVSSATVRLMTSDQLGSTINNANFVGPILIGSPGYTFGLGFAVRQQDGLALAHGSAGEFTWPGASGTMFWAEPKEKLCAVYMTQAPSPLRASYRRLIKSLVSQAIVN
ncbi:serine hydrolase domain-containing protein [Variovorax sp. ZT4R33]|uniref:serine hydrolase domain-containing protein n=1 Tax=Variovorax sp. ZT4R33 TaxID=3443743 RepID=UPI003F46257A